VLFGTLSLLKPTIIIVGNLQLTSISLIPEFQLSLIAVIIGKSKL